VNWIAQTVVTGLAGAVLGVLGVTFSLGGSVPPQQEVAVMFIPTAVNLEGVDAMMRVFLEPTPTPAPAPVVWPDQLSEEQMREVLTLAGWPESVHGEAIMVAWCESRWSPGAIGDHGASLGLFQVNLRTWFPYAGEDPEMWADPVVNARVALAAYRYSDSTWRQWTCKP
jgi:hypothetical protein